MPILPHMKVIILPDDRQRLFRADDDPVLAATHTERKGRGLLVQELRVSCRHKRLRVIPMLAVAGWFSRAMS